MSLSKITIADLEVFYRVGVTDAERAQPQRLLLTLEMQADIASAAQTDQIERTINYQEVVNRLLQFGENRSWNLIETLASNIADFVLAEYRPHSVAIEVKKFVIPQARYVSVSLTRSRPA